ncbi:hypothetical protein, variant [Aphanomyces invadans]|uniref:Arf-GAP domain-containing protein n=1 Tax=Aphanomyces invadans TaxID=157072 RepID=A0A024TYX4_9STRA|nr:hypothetical protein, variant [Aphanomyces invadans]ETV98542.1 hypothetical protein, variant [Aphanomyces invadans]|eukprot:XP_008872739.1 hypothetical protein, variant [Aphanomyces invadans]
MSRIADKLRNNVDNQACADCGVPVTASMAWATITHGAFVCIQCAGVHRNLGVHVSRIKSVHMDTWTSDELELMKGNRAANSALEKHVTPAVKAAVSRSDACRVAYIQAKYALKTFASPNGATFQLPTTTCEVHPQQMPTRRNSAPSIQVDIAKRFVNYFVVVGRGSSLKQTVVSSTGPGDIQFQPTILDSYPDPLPDAPLPPHIAQFAFPEGLTLSAAFREPTFFSFVLTNVSGAKLYACALQFDELLTPFEVMALFVKDVMPTWAQALSSGAKQASSVYSPKCLVVLSQYPFYSTFRMFLQQIYRLSLSEAPLPLERYVANFTAEIPVPPPGRVQVQLTLPECTVLVSRPPTNQLPHADVNFRPLFQMLDLNNVLTVFTCLLLEQKAREPVALCSKHLSVLTPIAEALQSLLFPLYWQGAYIPILPSSLLDIIDAPVPFLVGVHSKYLATSSRSCATDVFFVDLDHNRILPPSNDVGQESVLPKLPDREAGKLRSKLQEVANVFDPFAPEIDKADLAFDHQDYLTPIQDVNGTTGGRTVLHVADAERKASLSLDRKATLSFQTLKMLVPSQSTSVLAERSASAAFNNSTGSGAPSVNNTSTNGSMFLSDPVRHAFLRFFVSIFKRYATYLNPKALHHPSEALFDATAFLRDNSDAASRPFLATLIGSQMFQRFCQDRGTSPQLPEVLFFDASIHQKLNRSVTLGKKHDVSFLEDKSENIRETFVAPPPSTMGLPDNGMRYKYRGFPRLKRQLFGTTRKPRELFTAKEQPRHVAPVDVHQQIYKLSTCVVESGTSWDATRKLVISLQALYRMHRAQKAYRKQRAAVLAIQSFVSAHLKRRAMHDNYRRFRWAVVKLQSRMRSKAVQRAYAVAVYALTKLQVIAKGYVYAARYRRLRRGMLRLQAWYRRKHQEQWYHRQLHRIVLVQSRARGMLARIQSLRWRKSYLMDLKHHIFMLWRDGAIPLVYRSKFWIMFDRADFMSIGVRAVEVLPSYDVDMSQVHLEEIARLQAILGYPKPAAVAPMPATTTAKTTVERSDMDKVLSRSARKRRQRILKTSHTSREIANVRLDEERLHLYDQLKYHTTDSIVQSLYRAMGIPVTYKKKKRKLIELLWTSLETAQSSAEVS